MLRKIQAFLYLKNLKHTFILYPETVKSQELKSL